MVEPSNLREKYYRFIRDDVKLGAIVLESGKQILRMIQVDLNTNGIPRILLKNDMECIHTAVSNISFEEFDNIKDEDELKVDLLKARSSENLKIINLDLDEKFKAFKSWVAGIAEAGLDSFQIQSEIEELNDFVYPITDALLYFMIQVDSDFIPMYLLKMEKEAVYEGVRHEPYVISKLLPIFNILFNDLVENQGLSNMGREILKMLIASEPPDKLFVKNPDYAILLMYDWEYYIKVYQRNPNLIDLVIEQMMSYGTDNSYGGFSIYAMADNNPITVYLSAFHRNLDIRDELQYEFLKMHVMSFRKHIMALKGSVKLDKVLLSFSILRNWAIERMNFEIG
jgi:hypothetical protein